MKADRITTMQQNGGAPEAAVTLYPGEVMHARLGWQFPAEAYA